MLIGAVVLALVGCREETSEHDAAPVRGLKTHLVTHVDPETTRNFPSVLQPQTITSLAFEVSGRLDDLSLAVGQQVARDEIIASLDERSFQLQLDNARAVVAQTEATLASAAENLARQETLLQSGTVTNVSVDTARTEVETQQATLAQARASESAAVEDLARTDLRAPFDGIINSVDVTAFATVGAGVPIASIYSSEAFEAAFTVSFDVVNRLVVGTPVKVTLADNTSIMLEGIVAELGSRAETVSSFPVVVQLQESHPLLKAGMAVEVSLALPLPEQAGFEIPLTSLILDGEAVSESAEGELAVFVYDPDTATVTRRPVIGAGIRGNNVLIVEGLSPGDRIASAGVSFLREGQQVELLDAAD